MAESSSGPETYNQYRSDSYSKNQPNKVRVTFVEGDKPSPIRPPSLISPSSLVTGEQSLGKVQMIDHQMALSPPSSGVAAECEENPFRPDGDLSFEVAPIVQQFKERPWPLSPTGAHSPFSKSPQGSPVKDCRNGVGCPPRCEANNIHHNVVVQNSSKTIEAPPMVAKPDTMNGLTQNGSPKLLNGQDEVSTPLVGGGRPLDSSTAEVQHRTLASPRAKTVEVVHVDEKKKKCACCTIQ